MTLWLKKLRLYLLRRDLKSVNRRMAKFDAMSDPWTYLGYCDQRADLIDRIAEIEKTL